MLKAEVKFESLEQLRCAHGMCKASEPLTWKQVFSTVFKRTIVGEYREAVGYQLEWRFWTLLKTNPFRWKGLIWQWAFEDRLASTLAEEIRKEIDDELLKELMAIASVTSEPNTNSATVTGTK